MEVRHVKPSDLNDQVLISIVGEVKMNRKTERINVAAAKATHLLWTRDCQGMTLRRQQSYNCSGLKQAFLFALPPSLPVVLLHLLLQVRQ
jgi:hypothetical protein